MKRQKQLRFAALVRVSRNFQQATVVGELISTGFYQQNRLRVTGYTFEFWMGSARFCIGGMRITHSDLQK